MDTEATEPGAKDRMMDTTQKSSGEQRDRQPWQTPTIKSIGTISELLQTGGGKPSVSTADPGEPRKTQNQAG